MTRTSSDSSPQPLRAAARGFAELADWFTALARRHADEVAQEIDEDRFDATSTFARAAALPLIGWAAFLNEVLDAASVIKYPPQHRREATSDSFDAPDGWTAPQTLPPGELVNGFGEPLPDCVKVRVKSKTVDERSTFTLEATNIPHECVGVYLGTVPAGDEKPGVTAWLVIP